MDDRIEFRAYYWRRWALLLLAHLDIQADECVFQLDFGE